MAISKDEVKYIAQLAKLHFDEDEAEKFAKEFENILQQFKTLDALDLDDVVEIRPTVSVTRKDIPKKCEIEDLFRNVKTMRGTAIEVPKIIEKEDFIMSIKQLVAKIKSGEVKSYDVVKSYIDTIDKREDKVDAFLLLQTDEIGRASCRERV